MYELQQQLSQEHELQQARYYSGMLRTLDPNCTLFYLRAFPNDSFQIHLSLFPSVIEQSISIYEYRTRIKVPRFNLVNGTPIASGSLELLKLAVDIAQGNVTYTYEQMVVHRELELNQRLHGKNQWTELQKSDLSEIRTTYQSIGWADFFDFLVIHLRLDFNIQKAHVREWAERYKLVYGFNNDQIEELINIFGHFKKNRDSIVDILNQQLTFQELISQLFDIDVEYADGKVEFNPFGICITVNNDDVYRALVNIEKGKPLSGAEVVNHLQKKSLNGLVYVIRESNKTNLRRIDIQRHEEQHILYEYFSRRNFFSDNDYKFNNFIQITRAQKSYSIIQRKVNQIICNFINKVSLGQHVAQQLEKVLKNDLSLLLQTHLSDVENELLAYIFMEYGDIDSILLNQSEYALYDYIKKEREMFIQHVIQYVGNEYSTLVQNAINVFFNDPYTKIVTDALENIKRLKAYGFSHNQIIGILIHHRITSWGKIIDQLDFFLKINEYQPYNLFNFEFKLSGSSLKSGE